MEFLKEEWVPLVNERGEITGKAPRSLVHNGEKLLHPVVHLHFINDKGKILLQKRPADKLVQPGKWDTAVGGHISAGETVETAIKREALEETGVTGFIAMPLRIYRWETDLEAELVYMFKASLKEIPGIQSAEVDELKFWSKREIEENLERGIFTPNFVHEYGILISDGYFPMQKCLKMYPSTSSSVTSPIILPRW
jgi:isopentenyldiphosphate isomerase